MSVIAVDWSGAQRCSGKIWIAHVASGQVHRLERAKSREETIDALVSALVMDAHIDEMRCLEAADDLGRLEGEIWIPTEPEISEETGR